MKTIIIFEGIATAGKTTLCGKLAAALGAQHQVQLVTEDQTLMNIVNDWSFETAQTQLAKLLQVFRESNADVLISDRFHFIHVFRTGRSLHDFRDVEEALLTEFDTHIFLLTMDDRHIAARVQDSWNRRGTWLGKPGPLDEKVAYYRTQQQQLRQLASHSRLPVTMIDTSDQDWDGALQRILAKLSFPSPASD